LGTFPHILYCTIWWTYRKRITNVEKATKKLTPYCISIIKIVGNLFTLLQCFENFEAYWKAKITQKGITTFYNTIINVSFATTKGFALSSCWNDCNPMSCTYVYTLSSVYRLEQKNMKHKQAHMFIKGPHAQDLIVRCSRFLHHSKIDKVKVHHF
jgi:hypothetical protein